MTETIRLLPEDYGYVERVKGPAHAFAGWRIDLRRRISSLEDEIAEAEFVLEGMRDDLDDLLKQEDAPRPWPTKDVLLTVYGAPANWPVEAA